MGNDQEHGGVDEDALRRMFQDAVGSMAPSEGALDQLRKAVPARRARRRQALVGVAAAALLLGTAIPAFVHVSGAGANDGDAHVNMGQAQQTQGGTGEAPSRSEQVRESPSAPGATGPSEKPQDRDEKDRPEPPGARPDKEPVPGAAAGGVPVEPRDGTMPLPTACAPGQLGVALAEAGPADADGTVYGTFRIANISGASCTVDDGGTVEAHATGATDPARIGVARHTSGGPASGLPDPSQESAAVLLAPDTAYEVRFAWVPSEACPTDGESPAPTPSELPPDGEGAGGGTDTGVDGMAPQLLTEDGAPAAGGISVSLGSASGGPMARTTVPNACAGTVYQTGLLSAS
ncbi:hypothetical protein [Streptomyces clavuligerus]|uniref:hypothetical protein n=1 Tax=Streptomyces clavuligerus TaxID=1901 RepID=UPI0002D7F8BF|nr:hypothetical protein [Streptomyces clavuligerus]WDN52611.1 hypothetical protein LL058_12555 [Streptomyces clavuligerus]